ncbi:hypothetical protein SAMN04515617_10386 [Collimonas sp. OK242]|jgi:hypothetical protein|uniref:hypothetical protein n=1 Tax=Collimonas sp. OK242 TaxID=1798195 RepID=UPI00089800F3|nr:hypothetical protein [Collimonas sp. OK242]SDX35458.1 hypothetical protein SAMN04515617_10386 [Collimonas sp. OK242]
MHLLLMKVLGDKSGRGVVNSDVSDETARLLKLLEENTKRVDVSADGVVSVNLSNEDAVKKIFRRMHSLKNVAVK